MGTKFTISCKFWKIMIYLFWLKDKRTHRIWASWHFLIKTGCQKWCLVPRGPMSCVCGLKWHSLKWGNITKPIKCRNRVPLSRQYIYQLFLSKQQIPKLFQDTLLYFFLNLWKLMMYHFALFNHIFKCLKNGCCKGWTVWI